MKYMSISTKFENFCKNILISEDNVSNIKYRYERITQQLNKDFWNLDSKIQHSWYVGSYWRDTDIHISDVDILFQISNETYQKYNNYQWNWQSALLQAIKVSIQNTYKTTDSHWDWQVVAVDFTDWVKFEIVPWVLLKDDKWFWYPDTNNWWSWKTTNPFPEKKSIQELNNKTNKNLKMLCRMIRSWKDNCNVPIWWLLIDTFAYNFLKDWQYKDKSYSYYDWMVRDFFEYLKNQNEDQEYWLAPWSNQRVNRKWKFNYKATQAYNNILEAIDVEDKSESNANQKWKAVFGTKF